MKKYAERFMPIVTNCWFEGPPPRNFASWSDYFEFAIKHKFFAGIKISALEPEDEL